jgi:hypothetical protein
VHAYRFVGGPFDGQTFDYDRVVAVSRVHQIETASGIRMFRLLPSPDECERILRGELAMEQVDGPRYPYLYVGLAGNATELRDASDGTYVEALKANEEVRSRKKARDAARNAIEITRDTAGDAIENSPRPGQELLAVIVFIAVTSYFSIFCWLPMFLVDAPSLWLWAECALILILGSCCGISAFNSTAAIRGPIHCIGFASFLVMSPIAVFAPAWPDWRWLIPVMGLFPFWFWLACAGLLVLVLWIWAPREH